MSGPDDELLRIAALLRDRALARYRGDLDAEAALRDERAQIDALRDVARQGDLQAGARQAIGQSELWQGWLARRRTEVQVAMAQARARQGYSGAAARAEFARDEAARALAEHDRNARRARRIFGEEQALEELVRLRLWQDL